MQETVTQPATTPAPTTAEDTLKQKTRDANVISGGHLVAKALKNEGVDTIFTLCGGHIIDIYDGCIDEGIRIIDVRHEQVAAHAADGYARQTGKLGCVVTTAGPGLHQCGDRHRDRVPLREPGAAYRRPERARPVEDGRPAGPAACRHDAADHQVRVDRDVDRARRRHDRDGGARMLRRRLRALLPRDPARRPRPRDRPRQGGVPKPGHYRASTKLDRRSARHREARRHPGERRAPGNPFRPAGVDGARPRRGHRAAARPRHPGLFQRRRARPPAAGRSASFRPDALARLRQGRRHRHRRHAVRFPHGLRQAHQPVPTLVQIDMDYRTVGKNRDIDLGIVGDPGAVCAALLRGRLRPDQERQAPEAPGNG